jgi:hypothetical protein
MVQAKMHAPRQHALPSVDNNAPPLPLEVLVEREMLRSPPPIKRKRAAVLLPVANKKRRARRLVFESSSDESEW